MQTFRKIFLGFIFIFILANVETAAQKITAIKAGKLVIPETGETLNNQIILIEGAKIKEVGANVKIPSGADVIDLSRSAVLPGMFDNHAHMAMRVDRDGVERGSLDYYDWRKTNAQRAIDAVVNSRDMLESGFTTIVDIGNDGNYVMSDIRRSIDRGLIFGPTVINAGRIIAPFGGQYQLQPERRELGAPEYFFADTRDEMLKAVRENAHFGARVIKIVVDDQPYIYSVDDIKFIIAEAKNAGLRVAAHCVTERGARTAAEAGVSSIEHGFEMSDETLQIAKKNNVVLVGTDFTESAWGAYRITPDGIKQLHAKTIDRLKRAYKIGVTLAFGSDLVFYDKGETRGTWTISQIDSMVEAGISNTDILKTLTTNGAKLNGLEKQRGAIKTGQFADIIAVPENPLENISTLKKVNFVMKNGKVFKKGN